MTLDKRSLRRGVQTASERLNSWNEAKRNYTRVKTTEKERTYMGRRVVCLAGSETSDELRSPTENAEEKGDLRGRPVQSKYKRKWKTKVKMSKYRRLSIPESAGRRPTHFPEHERPKIGREKQPKTKLTREIKFLHYHNSIQDSLRSYSGKSCDLHKASNSAKSATCGSMERNQDCQEPKTEKREGSWSYHTLTSIDSVSQPRWKCVPHCWH